ncbi:MAG TPA: DUF4328 domain-containing protein [Verrucomicrobiae bacterium]|nr:DUF4328 domain-containing protein [Verrucomicrobiae bacterium]
MQQSGQVSGDGYWLWNGAEWVPNPYRRAAYAPWMHPYESAQFRATMVTVFIAANLIGVLLFIVFDGLDVIHVEQGSPKDTLFLAEGFVALLALLAYYATFIPAVVFYCMWLHRVVRNMPSLGSIDPRWTPGGAVGRCFIPFLNLLHPVSSVLDAWRGSWPDQRWVDLGRRKSLRAPVLIVAWWAAWLGARFVGWSGFGFQQAEDVNSKLVGIAIDLASQVLLVTSALLAILVVRRLTARQERKQELIASGQLA